MYAATAATVVFVVWLYVREIQFETTKIGKYKKNYMFFIKPKKKKLKYKI